MTSEKSENPASEPPQSGDIAPPAQRKTTIGGCLLPPTLLIGLLLLAGAAYFFGRQSGMQSVPTPQPTPQTIVQTRGAVVEQVQQISRLETTQYTIRDVVSVEREGRFMGIGGERILLVVRGTVVAGIDLRKITADDVTLSEDGKTLTLHMPAAEIFSYTINPSQTEVYDHKTGLFGLLPESEDSILLEAMQVGEQKLLQAACEDGIMQTATDNAEQTLEELLQALDVAQITIVPAAVPDCPDSSRVLTTPTP
jgi:hypothetical protein